ncbi:MAG: autotransporter domain-containing protein, partial [Methylococcales symbiont of Hymedesmia sp. n. MRB-2018]
NRQNPSFTAPDITSADVEYTFSLVVTDGTTDSDASRVTVTITENQLAIFGGDLTGTIAEDVTTAITGTITVTDADDNNETQAQTSSATTYGTFSIGTNGAWSYTLDNTNTNVNALAASAALTDTITVMAADGTATTITITITGVNDAPTAMATVLAARVVEGGTVSLQGAGTDPDTGDSITRYTWTQISPATPLLIADSENRQNPSFTAPDITSADVEYTFSLVVTDGTTDSDASRVTVTITENQPDSTVALTAPANQVYLAGIVISDLILPEATGGDGSYTYTLKDGSDGSIDYANTVNGLTFNSDPNTRTLSGTPATMAAEVSLTYAVTDGTAASTSATFTITVPNTYSATSTVQATSATKGDLVEISLGQRSDNGNNIQATGGTIILPSGLSGATITVLADVSVALLPDDQPDRTVANSRRSLVDIDVTDVSNGNPVTICLPYGDIANPGLYHAATNSGWDLLPSQRVETNPNLVCGDATGFSPFAVFGSDMQNLDVNAVAEEQVLNAVLPQMLRATTKITRDNISNRIDQAFASSPEDTDASLNLGGSSSLQELINNNARTTLQDGLNIKQMFNNSSFLIPLNVAGDNNYGINNITLWGSGDYLSLEEDSSAVDWEGEVIGGSVGIDARLNQNLIAGAALSYSEGDADYKRDGGENNSEGTLSNTLYSIHPYIAYDLSQGRVWGALGYGQGEVEINDKTSNDSKTKSSRDTELYSLAFGGSGDLLSSDNWLNIPGTTTLRLKGEVSLSNIKVDKGNLASAKALSINAHRYRMALESSHKHTLASGASISPSIELGIRYDDGSGETGGGVELAGSYRYSNPIGLEMELRAHGLLAYESNYKEWGLSGLVKYQANSSGQGLWLSLQPAWGDTPGNVADGVWQSSTVTNGVNDEDNSSNRRLQLNTELGYGLPGFFGRGLLTPYAGLSITNGTQSYNIGGRWAIDSTLNLSLIGEHKQTEDSIELRGDLKF